MEKIISWDFQWKMSFNPDINKQVQEVIFLFFKLRCFYNVFKTQSRRYLFGVISTGKRAYIARNDDKLPHFKEEQNSFKDCFFSSTLVEWNKLDLNIRNSKRLTSFRK